MIFVPLTVRQANPLLARSHYLGPVRSARYVFGAVEQGRVVAVQCWRHPSARNLPSDGTWLELTRWCLTPEAGPNAGSRQHSAFVKWLRRRDSGVTTFVSYSDPSAGHTGSLYRACNWWWAPTWHRLRPPPTGNGDWGAGKRQSVKDRWVFPFAPDDRRAEVLEVRDAACARLLDSLRTD